MSDSGANLWANSGCKMGKPMLTYAQEAWSPAPFEPMDPVTDTAVNESFAPDRDGGSGGATG